MNAKVVLIIILSFLLGWQVGHRDVKVKWANFKPTVSVVQKDVPQQINVDFKLFWDTWDLLSQKYIDKKALDGQKMFYGAISGMVSALGDPYTTFLPPEAQKSTKEDLGGSFEGVGIELGFNKDKRLAVISPLSGTPAEKSGIKPQDLIVKIDDKDTTGLSLPEAVKLIRGPKGTKITLSIFREGDSEPKDYNLTRETVIVKSVELSMKKTQSNKKVAVIKLSRFGERTKDEWNQTVFSLLSQNAQAVILDMRNNPGGFLEGAVFIGSEFLNGGDVVLQENNQGVRTNFRVDRSGKLTDIPLAVLINKGSASASEIVAGAIQDRKRGQLVGEKSFGKGTIQEAEDLENGTGIHITVAKWLTPNGRWVNETGGLDPDVKIKDDKDDETADPQMDKALELLE
ncbi:S41 family peptidase [Candidatus Daviesbacteria bacterium]|nr:S41 family peptidase [Candidatus Daviesbacteria bacterium]